MGKRVIGSVVAAFLAAPSAALAARDPNGDGWTEVYAAWAQGAEGPPIDWWTLLYFFVACLGIAVVAFKSPRRTHLD